jgi:excisionase family DNA binding protein
MSNVIPLGLANKLLTTKEAANRLGVSLRTIQLWVESSILPAAKTPGGHRRIPYMAVEALSINMGLDVVRHAWPDLTAWTRAQDARGARLSDRADVLLMVEDASSLQTCQQALAHYQDNLDVRIADDGYAGLIHFGQRCPALLIMQLNLHGIDGQDMLKALREKGLLAGVYVLIIASPERLRHFDVPDDVQVLPWPVLADALAVHVGRWLLARQTLRGDADE